MISNQSADVQPAILPGNPPTLLEIDAERGATFSAKFSDPQYRTRPGYEARWAKSAPKNALCIECAQLQHETGGESGPRMRPRHTRRFGDIVMHMCSRHAYSWHERDADDLGLGRGAQR